MISANWSSKKKPKNKKVMYIEDNQGSLSEEGQKRYLHMRDDDYHVFDELVMEINTNQAVK